MSADKEGRWSFRKKVSRVGLVLLINFAASLDRALYSGAKCSDLGLRTSIINWLVREASKGMDLVFQEIFQAGAQRPINSYYEALVKARDKLCAEFPDLAVEVLWKRTSIDVRNTKAEPEATAQIKLDVAEQTLSIFLQKYAGKEDPVVRIVIGEDGQAKLAVVNPPSPEQIATYVLLPVCFPDVLKKYLNAEGGAVGGDADI